MNKRKNIYRQYILLVLALLLPYLAIAQNVISGKVTDAGTGEPLIGATVIVKTDKKHGVATDVDGNFRLQTNKELPLTLHLDFVGYRGLDVDVYDVSEPVSIQLKENYKFLNGVVVVGYGTQKKSDISGAVASVNVDNIKNVTGSSFNSLLGGTTPGLRVTPTSGQPGGSVSLRVRGGSSIQGGNEPLYVIDGFPIYNTTVTAGAVSGAVNNPLASLNPGDIESITVLKDASATAIYGSRGANGVIIINTKHGKKGKTQVAYEGVIGIQSLRKKIDLLNAKEFASLRNDALYDTNPTKGKYQYLSKEEINALGDGTDWQDAAFCNAFITNHQLSITGGNENTQYAIVGNYYDQDGIIINTGFKRFSGRVNIDSKISKNFNLGLNLTASQTNSDVAPSGIISSLLLMPPTATIYESDGSYTLRNPFENIFSNPIASLNEQINKTRNYRFLGTTFGEYTFIKGLKLKILFGIDINNGKENNYIPSTIYEGISSKGIASIGVVDTRSWLNENTLSYTTTIKKKHNLNLLLGFTQQETKTDVVNTGSSNFVSDDLTYNSLQGGSVTTTPYSSSTKNSLISYLGRVNYDYDQRHFISFSIRSDGSSRFGSYKKWGLFPSVGYSWNISRETFFKTVLDKISNLKLRLSYGKTGNQEIGNYQSLSTLSSTVYNFGNTNVIGYAPDRISNNELGWETTYQFDAGLDIGFFNDRLNFTFDYYYKKTKDLLLNVEIPWTSGYSSSLQNYGSVSNKGLELSLDTKNFIGKFSWDTNFNISFNRNKVLEIGGSSDYYISGNYIIKVGQPLGTFYGAVTDGILQAGEESSKGAYTGNATPKAGDRLYKDINGDKNFTSSSDRTIIGNAQPDYVFGITNNISFMRFDLSLFITGNVGNDILNSNKQSLELYSGQQNADGNARDRWTSDNPSTSVPRAKLDPAPVFSDQYVEDGSFVRLKNLTLGYNVPDAFVKRLGLSALRLYTSATNLLTFTSYSGYDPEVTSTENTINQGTDSGVYPVARTYNFGITIKF